MVFQRTSHIELKDILTVDQGQWRFKSKVPKNILKYCHTIHSVYAWSRNQWSPNPEPLQSSIVPDLTVPSRRPRYCGDTVLRICGPSFPKKQASFLCGIGTGHDVSCPGGVSVFYTQIHTHKLFQLKNTHKLFQLIKVMDTNDKFERVECGLRWGWVCLERAFGESWTLFTTETVLHPYFWQVCEKLQSRLPRLPNTTWGHIWGHTYAFDYLHMIFPPVFFPADFL